MAVSYTCPNPDCGVTIKSPNRVPAGKSVKCPKCNKHFVPEAEEKSADAGPGVFKMMDEPGQAKKPAKPGGKKPDTPKKEEPTKSEPPKKNPFDDEDDEESIKKGYGVVQETEEEIKEAEKHKPTFTEVQDKFKKSARGPAQALLVMPAQLLTFEGLITMVGGVLMFVVGVWPLVFNDAPPGDEETEEAFQQMAIGIFAFVWGALICFGASEMHEIRSYVWSMVGSVMGVLPLLVGIFGIIMLQNPKVKAGFEEGDSGPDEDEDDEDDDDDDDDDEDGEEDDDEDEDDDEENAKRKKRKLKKIADDDDDDEDEKPKTKKKRAKRMEDD